MRDNINSKVIGKNILVEAKSIEASISLRELEIPKYCKPQVAYYSMLKMQTMLRCQRYLISRSKAVSPTSEIGV